MRFLYLLLVFMLFFLVSCNDEEEAGVFSFKKEVKTTDAIYGMDGIKLIAPSIDDPRDKATFGQVSYSLPYQDSARILMRLEKLDGFTEGIVVDENHRAYITITVKDNPIPGVLTGLRLCPLEKNWMMLATWEYAHPFPGNGKWDYPGGDITNSNCISGYQLKLQHGSAFYEDNNFTDQIFFDVSDWYIDYSANKENYGFALLNDDYDINVWGEANSGSGPRFRWKKVL